MVESAASPELLITRENAVTTLTMNRPVVRNALNDALMRGLCEALLACADDGTRCVILTGAGSSQAGAFSSGADLNQAMADGFTAERAYQTLTEVYAPTLRAIRDCPIPVIAAVDGYAAGLGCDMALACDIRLVSARAKFAELFIRIGLIPDGGGTYLLPRLVGTGRALEMIYTGDDVSAEDAVVIGLANRLYPVEGFLDQVQGFAARIAAQSPHALRRAKAAVQAAWESTYADSLAREAAYQRDILLQPDGLEGIRAFMEKRPAKYD